MILLPREFAGAIYIDHNYSHGLIQGVGLCASDHGWRYGELTLSPVEENGQIIIPCPCRVGHTDLLAAQSPAADLPVTKTLI